jgi:integrase
VGLFLQLPGMLKAEAQRRPALDRQGAVLMQLAIAIEILTMCPVRRGNLVGLREDVHFRWSRAGRRGVCHLSIDRAEVKNRQDLEFVLPAESADLLRLYLERYQPLLTDRPSSWLFPGRTPGKPKQASGFSRQIAQHVFRLTGIELHAHLFRHIGAKIHLDRNPGSYEVIRRVLGHQSIDTTTSSYIGFETAAATRHFDANIIEQRQATCHLLTRRRRKPISEVAR